jgi:hypothetical protein
MIDFEKDWQRLVQEREQILTQSAGVEERRVVAAKRLAEARRTAVAKLNDPVSSKEYRDKLEEFTKLDETWAAIRDDVVKQLNALRQVEGGWRDNNQQIALLLSDRKKEADKWQALRAQRKGLEDERERSDKSTVELRDKRDALEREVRALEGQRREFLRHRGRLMVDYGNQVKAENSFEAELLAQDEARRAAASRDLLKEFAGLPREEKGTGTAPARPAKPAPPAKKAKGKK